MTDASWPKITVITVVRNAVATLERAIESLRAQAYPNLEYIVLDAASTDGTLEIIKKHGGFISHWRSHKDDGAQAAINEGIARASGEVIALLNADDWYEPGILQRIGEAFRTEPSLDIVSCEAKMWKRDDKSGELVEMRHFKGKSLEINPSASPVPNARFFRRSVFTRCGTFLNENHQGQCYIAADLEFLLRMSQYALKNKILSIVGYHYLMHAGSLTMAGDPARDRQMYEERAHIAETYLANQHIPAIYQRRLKRWHRRGTTRLFFWRLKEKNTAGALAEAKRGMKISPLLWPLDALRMALTGKCRRL